MRYGYRRLGFTICAALLALSGVELVQAAERGFYIGAGAGQSDYDVAPSGGIAVIVSSPFGGGLFAVPPATTMG